MTDILIVAHDRPARPRGLREAIGKFRAAGCRVTLVSAADVSTVKQATIVALTVPRADAEGLWAAFDANARARAAAARADVIVALDQVAVHTAWQLSQRHQHPAVVLGLAPALREVAGVKPSAWTTWSGKGKHVARKLTGPRSQRAWALRIAYRTAITFAPMPSRVRLKLADRVADSLLQVQRGDQAARVTIAAARALPVQRRAGYLTRKALQQVRAGRVPGFLREAVTTELAASDRAYRAGDALEATRSYRRASNLLLHRAMHLDSLTSPLADDPAGFVAPLRDSEVGRALAEPRGRSGKGTGGPRILFMYFWNHNFVDAIQQRYEANPDTEVRTLDIGQDPFLGAALRQQEDLIRDVAGGSRGYIEKVEEILRPHLEWADTVFVDWCTVTPAVLTLVDPASTRVMVRLHSVEAFTEWPHLIDFSRVDDLVFVSEHLRDLVHRTIPALTAAGAPRSLVLTNAMDLRRFVRPKQPGARFALGLVGVNAVAKDPLWGVEVLRLLRKHDDRYRLVLIGDDRPTPRTAPERKYFQRLATAMDELVAEGAARRLGPTDDVPAALTEVGVILSSSVRESFHCGLAEGAASGAVPVVRDWPFFADRERGARTLFPAGWVVGSPAEAADRILAMTADEQTWEREGAAASDHAVGAWDWSVVAPAYDNAMLGDGSD
ncbi:glycosyltransferase [Actinoplanes sp. NBRC 103695]|uniref:glycosyltransferase n=1 Tax=Actinoplanes sp. NBRC 103695 TaxID=3032202 RepID=UPI0024A04B83|nr:glycosyltransferase [Actinoplanes sp. NBRC 103695]GLY97742.1 hypothetical protein Acsp02_49960 [Actinoplanes sp. NBRC 103695]